MTTIPTEGFPLAGLEVEGQSTEEHPRGRLKRLLGAITTYITAVGEQVQENNIAVTAAGEIVSLPNIPLPADQPKLKERPQSQL